MSTPEATRGAPLAPWAEYYGERGWQLVPCKWHRPKGRPPGMSPVPGVTGGAPFLPPEKAVRPGMRLHLTGGPDCFGSLAKVAIRPPDGAILIDVDQGYNNKTGADTLRAAQAAYGPLPASYSLTARGAETPSRRIGYRVPAGLVVPDSFFTGFGGSVEVIRRGHRFSWATPSIHVKGGEQVGAVRWYEDGRDPLDSTRVELDDVPHVGDLAELPWAWVQAVEEHNAARPARTVAAPGESAGGEWISRARAERKIRDQRDRLWTLRGFGGEFRNAVFGLGCAVGRLHAALGNPQEQARAVARDLFERGSPRDLLVDENDRRWIAEGVGRGYGEPYRLLELTFERCAAEREVTRVEALEEYGDLIADPEDRDALDRWAGVPVAVETTARAVGATDHQVAQLRVTRHAKPYPGHPDAAPEERPAPPRREAGLNLPEEFWTARPVLKQIRQAAHARNRSADAALGGLLARLASMTPPALTVDTGIAQPAGTNLFVAVVGPSGTGKTSGAGIAKRLLEIPQALAGNAEDGGPLYLDELPLGSGEGIAEAYFGRVEAPTDDGKIRRVKQQVRRNVMFVADEGDAMGKIISRVGATLGETLRRAWSGAVLGQANASEDRKRILPAGHYALGLTVGFQACTLAPILDDFGAGTPQRFLYLRADDPSIPEDPPTDPGPLPVAPFDALAPTVPRFVEAGLDSWDTRSEFRMASELKRKIRREDLARQRGDVVVQPLDAHQPLMLIKLSALLALLDARLDITPDDWVLAETIWATSCAVRDDVRRQLEQEQRVRRTAEEEAHVRRAVVTEDAVAKQVDAREFKAVVRVAAVIARGVTDGPQSSAWVRGKVVASRDRARFESALAHAVEQGWIVVADDAAESVTAIRAPS